MDFGDNASMEEFRQSLRAWLDGHAIERRAGESEARFLQRWHQELYRGGWVGLSWPEELGGRGLTPRHEAVFNEELGFRRMPDAPRIGYLGRALHQWGTPEQCRRYIPRLLSGEDYWCQGFSEPDAGSDLANIATRAESDGAGGYRVTGQKVWTSYGDHADLCLLLARTGDASARHRGISGFIVPMQAAGVEVRPLIASTGDSEFCEIFLDDVSLPGSARLGAEGDGWAIAMLTVSYERGAADVGYLSKFRSAYELLRSRADPASSESVPLDLGRVDMHLSVLSYHVQRRLRQREYGESAPGPEMSIDKLLMTTTDQVLHDTAIRLLGPNVLVGEDESSWIGDYLYSRAASVYGGTTQIQKNLIAQHLLGLPRA